MMDRLTVDYKENQLPGNPNSTTDLPQCLSIMSSWRYDVDFLPQSMLLPRGFRLCESSLRWWNPKHVISLLTVVYQPFLHLQIIEGPSSQNCTRYSISIFEKKGDRILKKAVACI